MDSFQLSPQPAAPKRMEWLDAMRGATMMLVVAYHIAQFTFAMPLKQSASMPFLVLVRMPLFFFVSGFLSYSSRAVWTPGSLLRAVGKKARVQITPTVVFLTLYVCLILKPSWDTVEHVLASPTKSGYWFTWTLFLMFVVYFVWEALFAGGRALFCRLKECASLDSSRPPVWHVAVLWLASLCLYETAYLPGEFSYLKQSFWQWSSMYQVVLFFHFFLFGNLVRRRWQELQRLFARPWFFPVLVLVAFVSCVDALKWHHFRMAWANLPRTVAMYSLSLMVVAAFHHYRDFFSGATRTGRVLLYIGQRTLDIYLLHFFLLPHLPMIGTWLARVKPGFVVEQVLTLSFAAVVVAFCCLLSHLLRVSPFLRFYLFGRH